MIWRRLAWPGLRMTCTFIIPERCIDALYWPSCVNWLLFAICILACLPFCLLTCSLAHLLTCLLACAIGYAGKVNTPSVSTALLCHRLRWDWHAVIRTFIYWHALGAIHNRISCCFGGLARIAGKPLLCLPQSYVCHHLCWDSCAQGGMYLRTIGLQTLWAQLPCPGPC